MEQDKSKIFIMNLPKKVAYKLYKKAGVLDDEETRLIDDIKEFAEKRIFSWTPLEFEEYDVYRNTYIFNLPDTLFKEKTEISYSNYDKMEVEYNENEQTLSDKQRSEIWRRGEFSVESKIPGLPYVWKLSSFTVKGVENMKDSLFSDLGRVFYLIYTMKYRFVSSSTFDLSLQTSFVKFFKGTLKNLNLLISLPKKALNSKRDQQIYDYIYKDFFKRLSIKLNEDNGVYDYSIAFPGRQNLLQNIQNAFDEKWAKESIIYEQEMFDQQLGEVDIKRRLFKMRYVKLFEYIEARINNQVLRTEVISAVKAHKIYAKYNAKFDTDLSLERDKILAEISNEYYIKKHAPEWLKNELEERLKPIRQRLIEEKEKKLAEKLTKLRNYSIIYSEYRAREDNLVNLKETYSQTYDKDLSPIYVPKQEFVVTRYLFPPFPVKERIGSDGRIYYYMEREVNYKVHTQYVFWRIWLLLTMFWAWSGNIALWMFITCYNSSFGVKALFVDKLYMDVYCDQDTGEVKETSETFTYISTVKALCNWMNRNRQEFENSPDTGFFGKNCARIFNMLVNYIGIGVILGFFVYFVYPVLIICYSVLAFILGLTCFVWSIFSVLCLYLFDLLLWDVHSSGVRACHFMALGTALVYNILILGVFQLIVTLILILLQPIAAFLLFVLSFIRIILRYIYDTVMYGFVYCLARLPRTDSGMAWKVKGPGLSKQYFNHISIEDALLCERGYLERLNLEFVKNKYDFSLDEPQRGVEDKVRRPLKVMHCQFDEIAGITRTIRAYQQLVNLQIDRVKNNFPYCPGNVKFTKEELFSLKLASKEIVKSFVEKEGCVEIWEKFNLMPNAWNRLSDKILENSVNNDINVPLDEMDFRIELVPQFNSVVSSSKEALLNSNPDVKKLIMVRKQNDSKVFGSLPPAVSIQSIPNPPFEVKYDFLPQELKDNYDAGNFAENRSESLLHII